MAERDNNNPGRQQANPNEDQPDEDPFTQQILEAIENDLHGSRTIIYDIYGTFIYLIIERKRAIIDSHVRSITPSSILDIAAGMAAERVKHPDSVLLLVNRVLMHFGKVGARWVVRSGSKAVLK